MSRYRPTPRLGYFDFVHPGPRGRAERIQQAFAENPVFATESGSRVAVGLGELIARQARDLGFFQRLLGTDRATSATFRLDAIAETVIGATDIRRDAETGAVTVSADIPVFKLGPRMFSRSTYDPVAFSVTTYQGEAGYDSVVHPAMDIEPMSPGDERLALMRGIGVALIEGGGTVDFRYLPTPATQAGSPPIYNHGVYGGGPAAFGASGGM